MVGVDVAKPRLRVDDRRWHMLALTSYQKIVQPHHCGRGSGGHQRNLTTGHSTATNGGRVRTYRLATSTAGTTAKYDKTQ